MEIQQVAEESYNQAKMVLDLMRQELLYLRAAMPKQLAEQASKSAENYNRAYKEHIEAMTKVEEQRDQLYTTIAQLKEEVKRLEAGAG